MGSVQEREAAYIAGRQQCRKTEIVVDCFLGPNFTAGFSKDLLRFRCMIVMAPLGAGPPPVAAICPLES